jgi:UDP-glucose 4-epimerase
LLLKPGESVENPIVPHENNIGTLVYITKGTLQKEQSEFYLSLSFVMVYGQADNANCW